MAHVAGIKLEKDSKGKPIRAIIDLRKRPEIVEYLNEVGAVEPDEFDKLWENGITCDELLESAIDHINKIFDAKEALQK